MNVRQTSGRLTRVFVMVAICAIALFVGSGTGVADTSAPLNTHYT